MNNFQKYTNINIPKNYELQQIFIAKNTFDYWMILKENEIFRIYKNNIQIWEKLNWFNWIHWIMSDNWNIIWHLWRKQEWFNESIKSISINWNIPNNEYLSFGFPQDFKRTKDWEYIFTTWTKLYENNEYMTRNWEIIFDINEIEDWTYNKLWNFIIKKINDNNIYLNWEELLFTIPNWWNLKYLKLYDNLEFILVYENNDIFYVIKNWLEVNNVILEKWLLFEKILYVNKENNYIHVLISKNIKNDDKYWISHNWKNTNLLFNYFLDDLFISDNWSSVIFKIKNIENKKYFIIQDDKIIFESDNLFDDNNTFYLWDIEWFENHDVNLVFNMIKSDIYWYKYNLIKEYVKKDFDKIDALVISNDWIIKFIWYKGNEIWLYYSDKKKLDF